MMNAKDFHVSYQESELQYVCYFRLYDEFLALSIVQTNS